MTLRRTAIAIASLALHATFILVLAGVPESTRIEPEHIGSTPIEIVPWRDDDRTRRGSPTAVPPARGGDANDGAASSVAAIDGPPTRTPPTQPRATRPKPQGEHAAALSPPALPTAPTPDDTRSGTRPTANALALQGLRDLGKSQQALPAPRVSAGALGPAKAGPAIDGPAAASGTDTGTPRSLGDAGFTRGRDGSYMYREPAGHFIAKMLPDGRVRFDDKAFTPTLTRVPTPDLYTIVSKAQKRELWARDKAELLKRTFDLRLAIAIAYAEGNVDRRIKELYRDLIGIWSDEKRLPVARRKTLFERWDECDESMRVRLPGFEDTTHSRIDELRATAGQRARTQIAKFIRKHLPAGSADAYDKAELDALNRRRVSRERFAPYDTSDPGE